MGQNSLFRSRLSIPGQPPRRFPPETASMIQIFREQEATLKTSVDEGFQCGK